MVLDPETVVRGTSPNEGGVLADGVEASAASALAGALQGLHRAFQKLALYPSGHPSVPQAIKLAARRFDEVLADRNRIVVRVTRHDLIWNELHLGEGSETIRALADLLHGLDLAALEFRLGLQSRDLQIFVDLLAESRRDSVTGAELVEALRRTLVESIKICAIDYNALNFADGTQQASGESEKMWEHLSALLTDPETFTQAAPLQDLADEVATQVRTLEGTGVNELRGELHRQMRESESLGAEPGKVFRRRVGDFVGALNPDLRRNLLQVGATRTRESISLINDLSDSIPPDEILEALQNVDRVGGQAHDELVQLLQKLVRISRDRPAIQNQLEDTLNRWGVSSSVLQDTGRLGQALEEVLRRRSPSDFNPSAYKSLLGDLTSGELSGQLPQSAQLYGDPSNEDAMRAHCAQIAVQLLGRSDGDEYRPALFGYVGSHAERLLRRGELAPVVHAVVAARADRALKQDNEDIARAARGFIEDFRDDSRIDLILSGIPETEPLSLEAQSLLELGGAPALNAVMQQLSRELDPVLAGSLREFCAAQNSTAWSDLLDRREPQGWSTLEPVFPVLRWMNTESAVPILARLFAHESSRVRREALILLCEVDRSVAERHLIHALGDESLRVVNTGLRRLSAAARPESITLLGDFIAGKVPGSWFSPESFSLALSLLVSLGKPGTEALGAALCSMSFAFKPLNARRGRRIAELIAPHRDDSAKVREALARWRLSPNRLLGRLLPAIPKHQGAPEA